MQASRKETALAKQRPEAARRHPIDAVKPSESRVPDNSFLYRRALPILLILMGLVMLGLIVVAAGVLTGLIPFQ
jgi:hypothetical protein